MNYRYRINTYSNMGAGLVCLTETWLKPDIEDSVVDLEGYILVGSDHTVT
jgi:hypothetical protein